MFRLAVVRVVFEMLLLKVDAAFCAAEKTDEKNPPGPGELGDKPGVLAVDLGSSMVGVSGTDGFCDERPGGLVDEADCTRR